MKGIASDVYDAMHNECSKGFRASMDASSFSETSVLALASGALTMDDPEMSLHVSKMMGAALTGEAIGVDMPVQPAGSGMAGQAPAVPEGQEHGQTGQMAIHNVSPIKADATKTDISILRNRARDTQSSSIASLRKNVAMVIADAARYRFSTDDTEKDDAWKKYLDTLEQRMKIGELFLGEEVSVDRASQEKTVKWSKHKEVMKASGEALGEKAGEDGEGATEAKADDQAVPAEVSKTAVDPSAGANLLDSILISKLTALEFCPIESPTLKSAATLAEQAKSLLVVTTQAQMEEIVRDLACQVGLANQLLKSIKAALSEVKRKQAKADKELKANTEKAARSLAELARKAAEEKERVERQRLANIKAGAVFAVKLSEAGHPQIPSYQSLDALATDLKEGEDKVFSKPFIILKVQELTELFDESSDSVVAKTMARWVKTLPGNKICKMEGKVVGPLVGNMGLDDAQAVFHKIMPQWRRISSSVPSFNAAMEGPTLYGHSAIALHFEPSLRGTLRLQAHGEMKFVLISAGSLIQCVSEKGSGSPTWDGLRDALRGLSEADSTALKVSSLCFGVAFE